MTHGSFDFPADSRGYTWGADAELYLNDWALRLGRFVPPVDPNDYAVDLRFWERYGDVLESSTTTSSSACRARCG